MDLFFFVLSIFCWILYFFFCYKTIKRSIVVLRENIIDFILSISLMFEIFFKHLFWYFPVILIYLMFLTRNKYVFETFLLGSSKMGGFSIWWRIIFYFLSKEVLSGLSCFLYVQSSLFKITFQISANFLFDSIWFIVICSCSNVCLNALNSIILWELPWFIRKCQINHFIFIRFYL